MIAVDNKPGFMTVAELAVELRVSPPRAYALIAELGIPHIRLSERRIRVPRDEFDRWMSEQTVRGGRTQEIAVR